MSTLTLTAPRQRLGLLAAGSLVGLLVAAVAGPALSTARAADDNDSHEHIVSVDGTGIVKVKPDVADVNLGVMVRRDRAGDASVDAANEMAKVVAALKAMGIAGDDIQTTTLSLEPVYDYDRSPATIVGYQATNLVNVTIRDIAKVGEVIDAAADAGATNINGISFRIEDQDAREQQAREAAMADARAKADTLASSAGVRITGVVSIVESGGQPPMPIYYAAEDMAAGRNATTPVLAGNVEVTVNVAVVYSIE